jgi:capsular polysaccharide biosynthesis protein
LDGPPDDWQEGPSLIESIRRYRWLIVAFVLIGAIAAFALSSRQPVFYEGLVRLYLDTGGNQADPGRIVRSQAEFLTSPEVLDRTVALSDDRLTREELKSRLTIEPARDADFITIKVLDATPRQAAALADTVVHAYRESVAKQVNNAVREEVAALARRQRQLEGEITDLDRQLATAPSTRLQANRDAKVAELRDLATQSETARRDAARTSLRAETQEETASASDEPAQPKPLRNAAIGALLAFVVASALAWWLNGRRLALLRHPVPVPAVGVGGRLAELKLPPPPGRDAGFRNVKRAWANGAPSGNGTVSGIADFDKIATSVRELFRFLEGPSQRLYEEDLPQLAVEDVAHRFEVDMAAILLDNAGEIQMMGSVGLRASTAGTIDRDVRQFIEAAVRSGPRQVDDDELVRLSSMALGGDQADSLALVPLVRDDVAFGVLLAGRRNTGEGFALVSDREVQEIADFTRDILPYVWAWLLLRNLKLRLRTLQ